MKERKLGRRQLERANRAFTSAALAELEAHGAVFDGSFHHHLPTRAGLLLARPIPSVTGSGGFVALRFDDVEAAKNFLKGKICGGELNPYSGKWNLNLYGPEFGEGCEGPIRSALRLRLEQVVLADDVPPDERRRRLEEGIRRRDERIAAMLGGDGSS